MEASLFDHAYADPVKTHLEAHTGSSPESRSIVLCLLLMGAAAISNDGHSIRLSAISGIWTNLVMHGYRYR